MTAVTTQYLLLSPIFVPITAAAAASPQSEGASNNGTDTAADGGEANAGGDATLETKTESAGEDAADDVSDKNVVCGLREFGRVHGCTWALSTNQGGSGW